MLVCMLPYVVFIPTISFTRISNGFEILMSVETQCQSTFNYLFPRPISGELSERKEKIRTRDLYGGSNMSALALPGESSAPPNIDHPVP